MKVTKLSEIFSGEKLPERINLDVEIKSQEDLTNFKVCDGSKFIAHLELSTEKFAVVKFFMVGNHLRIIYPKIGMNEKKIIITNDTKVFKIAASTGTNMYLTFQYLFAEMNHILKRDSFKSGLTYLRTSFFL